MFSPPKTKILNNLWTLSEITQAAVIVTLWVTLSVFSLSLKVLMHEGYLPIFYFIIWITGLLFSPMKGFTISVIGHFMFDLIYLANPLFLFVWIASGAVTALIAILRNSKLWRLLFFLPTICYLVAFFIMGYIQFNHPYQYFMVFPGVTWMLLIGNPLFNAFVIWSLRSRPLLIKHLASYCERHPQNIIVRPVDNSSTQNNDCSATTSNATVLPNNQSKFVWCKPKRDLLIYFTTFLSVIILWVGAGLLIFYRKPKRSIDTFLLLSYPSAYADKSFYQFSLRGACQYYQIMPQQCDTSNSDFRQYLGYGYPNSLVNTIKIFEYVQQQMQQKQVKNFILPGFTYTNFLQKYAKTLETTQTNLIAITTNYQTLNLQTKWPKNLFQFQFLEQLAGYKAGLYSALFALLNPHLFKDADQNLANGIQIKFASLGLIKIPPIWRFSLGFKAGIDFIQKHQKQLLVNAQKHNVLPKNYDLSTKVTLTHDAFKIIGGIDFVLKENIVKTLAKQLYQDHDISVIFSVAGLFTGVVKKQAEELNFVENKKHYWLVGVDADQGAVLYDQTGWKSQDQIITSATIDLAFAVKYGLEQIQKGIIPTNTIILKNLQALKIPKRYQTLANPVWKVWQINRQQLDDPLIIDNTINRIEELIKQPATEIEELLINPHSRVLNSN